MLHLPREGHISLDMEEDSFVSYRRGRLRML